MVLLAVMLLFAMPHVYGSLWAMWHQVSMSRCAGGVAIDVVHHLALKRTWHQKRIDFQPFLAVSSLEMHQFT